MPFKLDEFYYVTRREWMPQERYQLPAQPGLRPYLFVHHTGFDAFWPSAVVAAQDLERRATGKYRFGVPYNWGVWWDHRLTNPPVYIVELRGDARGDATLTFNEVSVAVLLMLPTGNTKHSVKVPDKAVRAVQYIRDTKRNAGKLHPQVATFGHRDGWRIPGHSGATKTSCPGDFAYARLDEMRKPWQRPATIHVPPGWGPHTPPPNVPVTDFKQTISGTWLLYADGSVWALKGTFTGSAAGKLPAGHKAHRLDVNNGYHVPAEVITDKGARITLRR